MMRASAASRAAATAPAARARSPALGKVFVGVSGFTYANWRGAFYPPELPARGWLAYASRTFNSIELNGTFYSLKSPDAYRRWAAEAPRRGFVFAIKGSRFITHNLKLARSRTALANFYASGVLALGRKTGPFLWQLSPRLRFDPDRVESFLELLPRDSHEAEALAREHDQRLKRAPLLEAEEHVRYRHAFEVRHLSFFTPAFYDLLRAHGCAFVISDTAGVFPYAEEVTAGFVYVRLHGSRELYASGYEDAELDAWAARVLSWTGAAPMGAGPAPGRAPAGGRRPPPRPGAAGAPKQARGLDVYVYFDNDAKVHAPWDAQRLMERVRRGGAG
jgi:uncharacterized protein YecE (DUF72 family)